ncbi:hypothetical protein [Thioalkalivibrio sp. ALE19]|uniref:hypothetical protein n=1 Tax=Thioalkalivibrio sp. ALE19 TaxID=1266909 RepID=UPI0012DE27E2|nr:hypothetical protein [Thioalkalivibrio sp. ALE19]
MGKEDEVIEEGEVISHEEAVRRATQSMPPPSLNPSGSVIVDDALIEREKKHAKDMAELDRKKHARNQVELEREHLRTENARLQALVEQAFREGHRKGRVDGSGFEENNSWIKSESRARLNSEGDAGVEKALEVVGWVVDGEGVQFRDGLRYCDLEDGQPVYAFMQPRQPTKSSNG